MRKKSFLLTLFCACVPGFGQMYQGYMKRGVSLLFWTVAVSTVAALLNLGALAFLVMVIWAYSFFDTFNIRNLTDYQRQGFYDEFIPSRHWMQENKLDRLARPGKTSRYIGLGCIIVGAIVLYNTFLYDMLYPLFNAIPGLYSFFYNLPTLLLAAAIILLGIWMIRRSRGDAEDDTIPFRGFNTPNPPTPPATPTTQEPTGQAAAPQGQPLQPEASQPVPDAFAGFGMPFAPTGAEPAAQPQPAAPAQPAEVEVVEPQVELVLQATPEADFPEEKAGPELSLEPAAPAVEAAAPEAVPETEPAPETTEQADQEDTDDA